jgi:hypothetical protein
MKKIRGGYTKSKSKVRFRIGAMCLITLLLLIPLLSSPVAAAFSLNLGSVFTNNNTVGPSASGSISTPSTVTDSAPFNANFAVYYDYNDCDAAGGGSDHWMVVTVSWLPPGSPSWLGPNIYTQGKIRIPANGGQRTGTYNTGTIVGYGGKGTSFQVSVVVYCDDLTGNPPASWSSGIKSFSVV